MDRARLVALASIALLVAVVAAPVSAQPALLNGFGGPVGFGTSCLGPNDDGYAGPIDIRPVFGMGGVQFFSANHTQMYVNTNGNISFSGPVPTYTPDAFPVASQPMIAPYWADVDIRNVGGTCMGPDGGTTPAPACHNPTTNGVWWHLDVPNERVVVTWHQVGYYDCKVDKRMTFQLILTAAPGTSCTMGGGSDFDVEFRFTQCEWNTGDASGGQNGLALPQQMCTRLLPFLPYQCPWDPTATCDAMNRCPPGVAGQSGFDAGNTSDFVEIMNSRLNTIHTHLCTQSNVGETGVWRFQIRSGVIVCPDAGTACSTGMQGVCADGITRCVGMGTECHPAVEASDELCDALDNDCDGMVDEGNGDCSATEVCVSGVCLAGCFEGGCPTGESCLDGRCVESGCETVTCPAGQRCRGGTCVDGCDGISCPIGLSCRAGRCVDLCAGNDCDACTVCDDADGACIARCQFDPCPSGLSCQMDGLCVEAACVDMSCPAGQVCDGGSCVDACMGATCGAGEMCEGGMCVPRVLPDAGVPVTPDGGTMPGTDAGPPPPGLDAGITPTFDAGMRGSSQPGCDCRASPGDGQSQGTLLLAMLAIGGALRRRRRTGRG
ncbi:MAG: nidogen-like domain-containing protein [Sandaracinaceae bacterium]